MTHRRIHNLYSPLRFSIVALWILSLVGVGASPLYYVTTSTASKATASATAVSESAAPGTQCSSESNPEKRNSLSLKFTHNPFATAAINSNVLQGNLPDPDGGMTHNPPSGSPVTLWLVSASASVTVGSSNLTRFHDQSDAADLHTRRPSTGVLTAASNHPEHPAKRFAATILGHKPSGVS
jgi:hypothetical protein